MKTLRTPRALSLLIFVPFLTACIGVPAHAADGITIPATPVTNAISVPMPAPAAVTAPVTSVVQSEPPAPAPTTPVATTPSTNLLSAAADAVTSAISSVLPQAPTPTAAPVKVTAAPVIIEVVPALPTKTAPAPVKTASKEKGSATTKAPVPALAVATTASTTATSTIAMGAAPIINDTDGQPANIQYNAVEATTKDLYGQNTMLPLTETLALLCMSLALFVFGIVCIRRDTIPMGSFVLSPAFSNRSIAQ